MPSINFCKMIAQDITSEHNQHASLLITGRTGIGKSSTAMAIAELTAQYIAEIKGGNPEDYFCPENIAIISDDEVIRVIKSGIMDKPYSIVGFDDIQNFWNARNFMSGQNQSMNDIATTIRTKNLFIYFTAPSDFMIDKVPRELVRYHMEITQPVFNMGYVKAKIKEPYTVQTRNKKMYPYLMDLDGHKIKQHIIFRPSQPLVDNYEKRRKEIETKNTNETVKSIDEFINPESPFTAMSEGKMEQQLKKQIEEKILKEKITKKLMDEAIIKHPELIATFTERTERISKKQLFSIPMKADYDNGNGLSMTKLAEKYNCSTQTVYEALHFNEPKQ